MRALTTLLIVLAIAGATRPALALTAFSAAERVMLRDVVDAADRRDWAAASDAARGPVTTEIARWSRLFNDETDSFEEMQEWLNTHPGWPGYGTIMRHAEARLPPSLPPSRVIAFFGDQNPRTLPGASALASALRASGRDGDAVLRRAWQGLNGRPSHEKAFVERWGRVLSGSHAQRMDRLLWDRNISAAKRMLRYVPAAERRLAQARIALLEDDRGVDGLIASLSGAQRADPGLAYARMRWREGRGRREGAEEIMLAASPDRLGQPEAWARARREFARDALERGDTARAYALAKDHGLSEGAPFAETEWLAGWIALRHLDRPALALNHFRALYEGVRFPISRARAAYWAERTRLAMGLPDKAAFWHERAAMHEQTFYGQQSLTARGLGLHDGAATPRASLADLPPDLSLMIRVGFGLHAGGDPRNARRFINAAARRIDDPAMLAALSDAAAANGAPSLALSFGKRAVLEGASESGLAFPDHPVPTVPASCGANRPDAALVRAIMRQESAFDTDARSNRNARGLMQLLPATARQTADEAGLRWSGVDRLHSDPGYNMTLGGCYLTGLLDRFGGDAVLAIAAYNAGPARVSDWIERFGDPRRMPPHERIDWMESVPFGETRSYIQRVLEGRTVYARQER